MKDSVETDYVMIQVGETLIGGFRKSKEPRGELSNDRGPILYFTVEELDLKVKRAKELGAVLVAEKVDLGKGRGCYQKMLDREKN